MTDFELDLKSAVLEGGQALKDPFEVSLKEVTQPDQGMGSKPNSWLFDENFEAGDSQPYNRADLAIPRTDFDEHVDRHGSRYNLDVSTTAFGKFAAPKHGPNWCD